MALCNWIIYSNYGRQQDSCFQEDSAKKQLDSVSSALVQTGRDILHATQVSSCSHLICLRHLRSFHLHGKNEAHQAHPDADVADNIKML